MGCRQPGYAHAGIVNTVEHACQLSGAEHVHAIIGGFHLARAEKDDLEQTISAIHSLDPSIIAPCHCSGLKAIAAFANAMPESFVETAVGTSFLL